MLFNAYLPSWALDGVITGTILHFLQEWSIFLPSCKSIVGSCNGCLRSRYVGKQKGSECFEICTNYDPIGSMAKENQSFFCTRDTI